MINITNNIDSIVIVNTKKIFVLINKIAITIIIGKVKNIMKLNITLRFNMNIRKYNRIVLPRFRIVILLDNHTDLKTFLLSMTIKNLEYENRMFIIIHKKSIIKNI